MSNRTKPNPNPAPRNAPPRKLFSLEEANRALPYVSRIVLDIRQAYTQALTMQQKLERLKPGDDADKLRRLYDNTVSTLNRFVEELHEVGVEIKDYEAGLIDFSAMHQDRPIQLCWKLGEEKIVAWHEVNAGFAGRQDVSLLQPSKACA